MPAPKRIYVQLPSIDTHGQDTHHCVMIAIENYLGIVEKIIKGTRDHFDPWLEPKGNPDGNEFAVVLPHRFTAGDLESALWIPCCHTSGMHDPVHFQERRYICESQKAAAFDRLCGELNLNPETKSKEDCGWCKDYPVKKAGEHLTLLDDKKARE